MKDILQKQPGARRGATVKSWRPQVKLYLLAEGAAKTTLTSPGRQHMTGWYETGSLERGDRVAYIFPVELFMEACGAVHKQL